MSAELPPLPEPIVKPWQVPIGGLGRPMQERVADWANGLIAAAVAAERERCAKLCEGMHDEDRPSDYAWAIRTDWAPDSQEPSA